MNERLKDNLYVFSIPAIYIALLLYNWYISNYIEQDELNIEQQQEELTQNFMDLCEDNLWLMATLSLILNHWIFSGIVFIANLIF